jgi:hypothetical protein
VAIGVDDEGSVVELLVVPAGNGANGVHLVLTALLFDGLQCGRILKIFRELMHVLLDIGRVADLPQHGHVCPVLARSRQRLSNIANVL